VFAIQVAPECGRACECIDELASCADVLVTGRVSHLRVVASKMPD
jgi:hypothetical protein